MTEGYLKYRPEEERSLHSLVEHNARVNSALGHITDTQYVMGTSGDPTQNWLDAFWWPGVMFEEVPGDPVPPVAPPFPPVDEPAPPGPLPPPPNDDESPEDEPDDDAEDEEEENEDEPPEDESDENKAGEDPPPPPPAPPSQPPDDPPPPPPEPPTPIGGATSKAIWSSMFPSWNSMFAGTSFGIAPPGTLAGQSASMFGGTSFGIAPPGTPVGQSAPMFGGGFGIAPPGTLVGQSAPMVGSGFGIAPLASLFATGFGAFGGPGGGGAPFAPGQQAPTSRCGPDITRWMAIEMLVYWTYITDGPQSLNKRIEALAEIAGWPLRAAIGFLVYTAFGIQETGAYLFALYYMYELGKQLNYKFFTSFRSPGCPRGTACNLETATFGGVCIHRSEIGNFAFGCVGRYLGLSWEHVDLSARVGNIMTLAGDYSEEDQAAVVGGYQYCDVGGPISDWIAKNGDLLAVLQRGAAKECAPCTEEIGPHGGHSSITPEARRLFPLKGPAAVVVLPGKVT